MPGAVRAVLLCVGFLAWLFVSAFGGDIDGVNICPMPKSASHGSQMLFLSKDFVLSTQGSKYGDGSGLLKEAFDRMIDVVEVNHIVDGRTPTSSVLAGLNVVILSPQDQIASFDRTIWTADCNSHGTQAVIGTNLGAALINLETEEVSWFYRSRSDVFSQQFIHSGNVVLCGHRNGAVISVDIRQKQSRFHSAGPSRQNARRIAHVSPVRNEESSTSLRHKLGRNLNSSDAVFMSSAVCSLVALQSDDKYFLASSMDGSIKLFDCRLLQRGSVQSYAGHVNSHTRLQLGVNPSETFLISGGEDCFLRIWSIKNGELIFGEKVSDSILTTVCWPKTGNVFDGKQKSRKQLECCSEYSYFPTHSWGTWLGSPDGLFYMHGT